MTSWLTGLASKAEDMLNTVDKAAATSLSKTVAPSEDPYSKWTPKSSDLNTNSVTTTSPYLTQMSRTVTSTSLNRSTIQDGAIMTSSSSVPSNLNKLSSDSSSSAAMSRSVHAPASSKASPGQSKRDKDEELFEFLNSPDSFESNGGNKRKDKPASVRAVSGMDKQEHSRQSSTSSVSSQRSTKLLESDAGVIGQSVISNSDAAPSGNTVVDAPTVNNMEDLRGSDSSSSHQEEAPSQQLSSLELENRLLKNEVASLNQEMSSLINRAKDSQEEVMRIRQKMEVQSHQFSQQDQLIRELRARESDTMEAISAKDSQLAVLRVRFEEVEKVLHDRKMEIDGLQGERNRILADHTSVSGVQNEAMEGLKMKLQESGEALRRQQDAYTAAQQEAMQQQSKLEAERKSLAESVTNVQRKFNDEKVRCTELATQLKTAKLQADTAKKELTDYKEKAARILQSKDKLIGSLKEGSSGGSVGDPSGVSAAEVEEAHQERDMMREELQQCRMTIETLRTEIQDLEMTIQTDQDAAAEKQRHLEEQLAEEKSRREEAEHECNRQKQELRYSHEEMLNQKTGHQRQLSDRDVEIDRLRNQLTAKSLSTSSQTELENRLHSLTESLIHKQTIVEALSTEKNSLVLQLERLEHQYKDIQEATLRASVTTVDMRDDEEVRQRLPGFMRESPLDGDVTRKVKRAANSIDKFSIRLGVFLRRYPIARVFVICYMALLHLWVMIVLLTYQPEVHGHDYSPQAP